MKNITKQQKELTINTPKVNTCSSMNKQSRRAAYVAIGAFVLLVATIFPEFVLAAKFDIDAGIKAEHA